MSEAWLSWPRPPLAETRGEPVLPRAARRRLSFTSSATRTIWEPRLERLASAALATELQQVAAGRLRAALVWCAYDGLPALVESLKASNLAWKLSEAVLPAIDNVGCGAAEADPLTRMIYSLTVTRSADELDPQRDSHVEIAEAFGYPLCCAQAWAQILSAGGADPLARLVADRAWLDHPGSTSVMLGNLGFGPVRHLPCRPGCEASRAARVGFLETMKSLGLDEEASWLAAMSEWRARGSVAGGIGEVETGAFRFVWKSEDLGAPSPSVASGTCAPEGAPAGLSSVFEQPSVPPRRRRTAERAETFPSDDDHAAAGFATRFAHRSRLSCIVWEQSKLLRKSRTALHLGCGGGLLVELLVQSRPSLRLCGIEADPALASRARARLGGSSAMILDADWMAEALHWPKGKERFDLLFVDPEPLIDMPAEARRELVAALESLARSIILIASDRALCRFGSLDSMAEALGLDLEPGRDRRVSAAAAVAGPDLVSG